MSSGLDFFCNRFRRSMPTVWRPTRQGDAAADEAISRPDSVDAQNTVHILSPVDGRIGDTPVTVLLFDRN
jgi:hypothetical protein